MKIDIRKLSSDIPSNRKQMRQQKNCRLSIFLEGETILENLMERHSRPYNLYKKVVVPSVEKELRKLNVVPSDFSWSQKAGCPCGCSPGFRFSVLGGSYNIYVTVKASDFEKFIEHVQIEMAI